MRWTEALHIAPMAVIAVQAWLASPAAAGLTSLDNPWWRPGARADRYPNVLPRVDVLLPSEADVAAFFGRTFHDSMVKELVERGARRIVVKQGSNGCVVHGLHAGKTARVGAFPMEAVDPTRAGDAFCGGFMASFLETGDAVRSAIRGAVSASFAIGSLGIAGTLSVETRERHRRERWLVDGTTMTSIAAAN